MFVCVTGVSGSGKSSLVNDILVEALHRDLNAGIGNPGEFDKLEGIEHLDKMIAIDQSPIGRTPRSNPATYIKVFDEIRRLYTQLPEAKAKGFEPGRFSFNVSGGRCEACEGNGSTKLEMDFLADIWVTCPVCEGHRFNRETLQVRYKGKSIAEVLEMDVQEALTHFENIPAIADKLRTLHEVGLDYVKLGQPSPTLSGGEAQRIKLARELVKKSTGRTLYLLDEPTTGLHFADIQLLLKVLHGFVEAGNTVLVVEHNTEVIKTADWIIDLGPEGGAGGGRIIATGTPEQVAENPDSFTGQVLKRWLGKREGRGRIGPIRPMIAGSDGRGGLQAAAPRRVGQGDQGPRRPAAQSQGHRRGDPPRPDDRLLRPQRQRQDLAGHGYDLRRRPAALRGKPQFLRPAVRRQDAEAAAGSHRGPLAGHRHRAEARRPLAPQHGRHGHRDLRLPADHRLATRPAALPRLRPAGRHANGRRDHRQDHAAAGGHAALSHGPAGNRGRREVRSPLGRDAGRRIRPRADRRPDPHARPTAADRPAAKAPRRSGHRPRYHPARRPQPVSRWPAAWRMPWPRGAACST